MIFFFFFQIHLVSLDRLLFRVCFATHRWVDYTKIENSRFGNSQISLEHTSSQQCTGSVMVMVKIEAP